MEDGDECGRRGGCGSGEVTDQGRKKRIRWGEKGRKEILIEKNKEYKIQKQVYYGILYFKIQNTKHHPCSLQLYY